jgi:hypothetical protein
LKAFCRGKSRLPGAIFLRRCLGSRVLLTGSASKKAPSRWG